MKTRNKIIILAATVLAVFSFYLFMVANGFSPYMEGISMTYYKDTDSQKNMIMHHIGSITTMTDADLDEVPRIRGIEDMRNPPISPTRS